MQEQKLATLLVALADRSTLDWHGSKDFWKTVDEAKAMFGQRIVAVILSAETGFAALDVTVASSVPNRDGILAWLDANGAQRMQ